LTTTTPGREPLITVVIACLNASDLLPRCLDSIIHQDYPHVELVVADGGSNDGTIETLRRYAISLGSRLKWASEPDSGIGNAWNKAVDRSRGDWLLFLGADDSLASPTTLSDVAPALAATDRRIVYGDVELRDREGAPVGRLAEPWSPAEFRKCRRSLPHQAVFHHRSLFGAHGRFDECLRITSDYDFLLRELTHSEPLYLPGVTISNMQIGGASGTRRNIHRLALEQVRLFRRHVGGIPIVLSWWLIKSLAITLLYGVGGDRLALRATNFYRRWVGERRPLKY
jgi:glycosyltransferase involved in cell wall biosynthesis